MNTRRRKSGKPKAGWSSARPAVTDPLTSLLLGMEEALPSSSVSWWGQNRNNAGSSPALTLDLLSRAAAVTTSVWNAELEAPAIASNALLDLYQRRLLNMLDSPNPLYDVFHTRP